MRRSARRAAAEADVRAPPLGQNDVFVRIAIMNTDLTHSAIVSLIHTVRGQRVILDSDLARLYNVPTKRINEQTRRNPERFLGDFAFRLSAAEANNLRSQFATSSWGGRRYLPFAFTEHGAIMAASMSSTRREP